MSQDGVSTYVEASKHALEAQDDPEESAKRVRPQKTVTTVYAHKGCNDGHLAAALYVLGLLATGHSIENIELRFLSAGMSNFEIPARSDSDDETCVWHAVFVDLSPTTEHDKKLEAYYDHISVFDHHLSSADFLETKRLHLQWFVMHTMEKCGSSIVFDHFFKHVDEIAVGDEHISADLAKAVVDATDAYDTWKSPTPEVFKFVTAMNSVWSQCTQPRTSTTIDQLLEFFRRVCSLTPETVEAMTGEWWASIKFEAKIATKFVVELPTADGEKLRAITWFGDAVTNPSIVAHMILDTHLDYEVAMCLFRKNENGSIVYQASLRSRTLNIPSKLNWARGHAQACGGMLPNDVLNTFIH